MESTEPPGPAWEDHGATRRCLLVAGYFGKKGSVEHSDMDGKEPTCGLGHRRL